MIIELDKDGIEYSTYSHEKYHSVNEYIGSTTLKKCIPDNFEEYFHIGTKDKIEFKLGNAFELMVSDRVFLDGEFFKLYSVAPPHLKSRPSNIFDIIKNKNADELRVLKKNGEPKELECNHWLDELKNSGYKFPLKTSEYELLDSMVENFLKMTFRGWQIDKCIGNSIIERPIFWDNGIKKKCKPDFYFFIDDTIYLFDIKTYGKNIEQFKYDFHKMGYWVQAVHYREGLSLLYPDYFVLPMCFAVGSKAVSHLAQCFPLDVHDDLYSEMEKDYEDICRKYYNWDQEGRNKNGFIKTEGKLYYKKRD